MTASPLDVVPAIILAGGKGTRIRSVHPDLPKPLIPVAGKPFLVWQIEYLRGQGIREVILSIGYRASQIQEYFASHPVDGVHVTCVVEDEPRGTGGAVRFSAAGMQSLTCFVLNGDSLCPAALEPMAAAAEMPGVDAVILASRVDDARDYGTITTNRRGGVTGFLEKGAATGAALVNAGVYCVRTAWAREMSVHVPLSIERDVFPAMSPDALRVVTTDAPFIDIGVPERLAAAETFLPRYSVPDQEMQ